MRAVRLLVLAALVVAFVMTRGGDETAGEATDGSATATGARAGSALAKTGTAQSATKATPRVAALPPVSPGALRLEGLVVDSDERPAGGVRVVIGAGRAVTTEADGGFAFDGLAEGKYTIVAEQGEWFAENQDVMLHDDSEPVTLQLTRGPTLIVHIVDEASSPIAGANVSIGSREYKTPDTGTVVLRAVDTDGEYVVVSAPGKSNRRERVSTGDDPAATFERTITLRSGALISGMVLDANGAPLAEAYVELEAANGSRGESVWSDAQGLWRAEDMGGAVYLVRASTRTTISAGDQKVIHDGVHPKNGIVLRVAAGAEIAGIVVDAAGKPVPEARISGGGISETTDESGRFVARGLDAKKYTLSASTTLLGAVDQDVTLERAEHADVKFVLVPSSIAGKVVDASGQPVENAAVAARSEDPEGFGYSRTDEYGHFDMGGLPPGRYKITASREESSVDSKPIEAATGNRSVRVVVPDRATLVGRVLLDGVPVPYFGIVIAEDPDDEYSRPKPVRDPDGRFIDKDPELGTFAVILIGPTFARHVIPKVRFSSGQVTDLGDIAVSKGETIRGRVTDERGAGIAGASVRLAAGRAMSDAPLTAIMRGARVVTTDASGNYEIPGAPPPTEERTLEATHAERGSSGLQTLAAQQTVLDLVLAKAGAIDGTVVRARREHYLVTAQRRDDSRVRYTGDIDSNGAFAFPHLSPGVYEIEVVGRNTLPTQVVTVTSGETAQVTFELPEDPVQVRVHVRGTCGMVDLRTLGEELLLMESCTDQIATFDDVAPGRYQLCADGCMTVDIPRQPTVQIELQGKL
jgi:protocatechuate 3,4-dioxygenase beta subunit